MDKTLKKEFKQLVKNLRKQSMANKKREHQNKIMNHKIKKLYFIQNKLYNKLEDLSKLVTDK